MSTHATARPRTNPYSRRLLVKRIEEGGWPLMEAAQAAGISGRTAHKWLARWRSEGETGLLDRSSAPKRVPSRLPADRIDAICAELGLRHLRTRPYRPRTNGKAERFIQTLQNKWAYGAIYGSSAERTATLPGWLWHYNFRKKHGSLGKRPPAARLAELEQGGE